MASQPSKANVAAEYDSGIKNFPGTSRNITFDPGTGTMIELAREEDRTRFFDRFTKGGQPVYVISATNNTSGDFSEVTREAYIALRMEGRRALLGQWTDPDGHRFRDTSFVVSGIGRREALTYKSLYDQQEILEVERDGVRSI